MLCLEWMMSSKLKQKGKISAAYSLYNTKRYLEHEPVLSTSPRD